MKEGCNRCWDVYESFDSVGKVENSQHYFDGCSYKVDAKVLCLPLIQLLKRIKIEKKELPNQYPYTDD